MRLENRRFFRGRINRLRIPLLFSVRARTNVTAEIPGKRRLNDVVRSVTAFLIVWTFACRGQAADLIQVETAPSPISIRLRAPLSVADITNSTTLEDARIEASAVETIDADGRFLLIADDKTNGLVVVEAATGLRIGAPLTLPAFPTDAKWEGMAKDDSGAFYIIGSHNGRTTDEIEGHSRLLRFRLTGGGADGKPYAIDPGSVVSYSIGDALKIEGLYNSADPKSNRVKIEGLTVRTVAKNAQGEATRCELIIGLREPDEPITMYAGEIPAGLPATAENKVSLRKLMTFSAGTREATHSQLASIEYAPAWNGFLILTSTEDQNNAYHGNTLWFAPYPAKNAVAATPQKVWVFGPGAKAEGICLQKMETMGGYSAARIAIVYDNDPARTKMPSVLQCVTLVRWPE